MVINNMSQEGHVHSRHPTTKVSSRHEALDHLVILAPIFVAVIPFIFVPLLLGIRDRLPTRKVPFQRRSQPLAEAVVLALVLSGERGVRVGDVPFAEHVAKSAVTSVCKISQV